MVQQVKHSALSLLWLWFIPWPRNFCMPKEQPNKKKKKKKNFEKTLKNNNDTKIYKGRMLSVML